ncbi:MRP-L47-domain-containing protein [Sodiomyces alkalinus F11]|uniref:Large ribosomal subunit protein uL29m n=1 Tax=Sodiomyces alkalinus (strain CBS 110278 / VKM F-3762 / F11) TaxID=1314773 RepID=A0A3N2PVS8_SODAK|nr:MRP-L47-domain-containing protein [Sodiomyces alkalinus F11]ROT38605.1 MRP-L47-domain-containing protein [Sodiomyces alkalinus F11]
MTNPTTFTSSVRCVVHTARSQRTLLASRPSIFPLPTTQSAASFSTSSPHQKRKTRDNNRLRGVSPLRRTGPREPLSVSYDPLPKPADYKPKITVDKDHGLWGFFPEQGKLMNTPEEDGEYGRAWTANELRQKSWEDLHALWWACCRERNRLATANAERSRAKMGFGEYETNARDDVVKRTMKAIKHVLTERYYLWEDAYELAKQDPEINLSGKGEAYTPLYEQQEEDFLVKEDGDVTAAKEASTSQKAAADNLVDPSTIPASKPSEQAQKL